MENLETLRSQIDALDAEISKLLERRLALVSNISKVKKTAGKAIYDPAREQEVIDKLPVENPEYAYPVADTFRDIMRHSRDFQDKQK
ncbi:MAG: chorismate mutase [Streptococcaceae bacterium]|jgi:monofunctional chorismate mutase|nr:chorismate mutase [Streptococcaceae bacterium]